MRLQPVIGLETHVELSTKTKMFCGCNAHAEGAAPNTYVCPICTGHPGTLPVPNAAALRYAVLLGLALNGTITEHSKFDRKHYFYPDLPKAYQISQFDLPVMQDGELFIDVPGNEKLKIENETVRIGIERMHLEEDSAKNIHGDDGRTYVDFNRSTVPLCEIVTKPDFRTSAQAKAYVQELRLLVRMLGISNADMEKGQLRCDVNVSLREVDENGAPTGPMHPKTEIKNINSFRAIERAVDYEIARQTALWEAGTPPTITTTRGWNDANQCTDAQRTKEDSADYRFFPEPDIPPLDLHELVQELKRLIPELPRAKRQRFIDEYGFKPDAAKQIIDDADLAFYTEAVMSELNEAKHDFKIEKSTDEIAKLVTGWLLTKFANVLTNEGKTIATTAITPAHFADFLARIMNGTLTPQKGLEVLALMEHDRLNADDAMKATGAESMNDSSAIDAIISDVIASNPAELERYKNGETKLFAFFLGQIMKAAKGNANPASATEALKKALA